MTLTPLPLAAAIVAGLFLAPAAWAQQGKAASAPAASAAPAAKPNSPLSGFGSTNKEPYKIDANKLEVSQKDNKAVYSGDVVVIQGKTTMRCTSLVIFFDQKKEGEKKAQPASTSGSAPDAAPQAGGLKRLECHGPVTVTQEKQSATSNLLVYEADVVTLSGNVLLSDGASVQAGEKLTYQTKTGVGTMEGQKGGRVRGIFDPSSGGKDGDKKAGDKKAKTG